MPHKAFLLLHLTIFLLFFNTNIYAEALKIIPLKKPALESKVIKKKIVQGILKPKPKPKNEEQKEKKETVKIEKKEKVKKVEKSLGIILPKSKPLIVKKEKLKSKEKSKYFRQKDYILAKNAIQEMEKRKWDKALRIAKKARDKSIYNFIQWRYLLTKGNRASFYDYQEFINKNENYPRINRIKYLAEHKLSTDKISPKKIINWFNEKEPLSGFGKLILGESYIINGNFNDRCFCFFGPFSILCIF